MYQIIMTRNERIYVEPRYGIVFGYNGGQLNYYEKWSLKTFKTLNEAENALNEINKWFQIDGRTFDNWHKIGGVWSSTGEGIRLDYFKENRHIIYEAYIETLEAV